MKHIGGFQLTYCVCQYPQGQVVYYVSGVDHLAVVGIKPTTKRSCLRLTTISCRDQGVVPLAGERLSDPVDGVVRPAGLGGVKATGWKYNA